MHFVRVMSSGAGRLGRVIVGAVLMVVGLVSGGDWYILSALGFVVLLAGAADICLFAPLFKQPIRGRDLRK